MKKFIGKIKCFFGYHKTNDNNWVSIGYSCLYNGMGDHQHQNCERCEKQQYRSEIKIK